MSKTPGGMFAAAAGLLAAATLSSCASEGYIVDLKPETAQAAAKDLKGRYSIEALHYETTGHDAFAPGDLTAKNFNDLNQEKSAKGSPQKVEELRKALAACCRKRFPGLFAAEGEEAIPVAVNVKSSVGEVQMIGPVLCGFTLGVVPGPYSLEHVYEVSVTSCPAGAFKGQAPSRGVYEQAGWGALFPTGLIPYPGRTDAPAKTYTLAAMDSFLKSCEDRNLELLADEIALQLAANNAELAGTPSIKAGQGSALPEGAQKAPGGGLVAPQQHETPAKSEGLAL